MEFPSVSTSDEDFDKYLKEHNLELATMITLASETNEISANDNQSKHDNSQNPIAVQEFSLPRRSAKPLDVLSAKHCVGYNMIMVGVFIIF